MCQPLLCPFSSPFWITVWCLLFLCPCYSLSLGLCCPDLPHPRHPSAFCPCSTSVLLYVWFLDTRIQYPLASSAPLLLPGLCLLMPPLPAISIYHPYSKYPSVLQVVFLSPHFPESLSNTALMEFFPGPLPTGLSCPPQGPQREIPNNQLWSRPSSVLQLSAAPCYQERSWWSLAPLPTTSPSSLFRSVFPPGWEPLEGAGGHGRL